MNSKSEYDRCHIPRLVVEEIEEEDEAVEKGRDMGGVVREEGVVKVIGSERGGDGGVKAGSTHGLAMLPLSSLV